MSGVRFTSHKNEVIEAKERAISAALTEIGLLAERFTKAEISKPKPHKSDPSPRPSVVTDNLRSSIGYETDTATETAYVGSNVEYAPFVC